MTGRRGILGVKRDPKKQLLFSFKTRKGEEWPSDDSDSDYEPEPGECSEESIKTTRKRKLKEIAENEKVPSKIVKSSNGKLRGLWSELPPEILQKIFQCITDVEGAVPFLVRMARVCGRWAEAARHPSLWSKVDLSAWRVKSEDRKLAGLCPLRLRRVRQLNLSSWKNLTDIGLQAVADHCPLLESIDISYCSKLKGQALQNLVNKCQHISKLNISNLNVDAVKAHTVKYVLEKCGPQLRALEMAGNKYVGFNSLVNILQNSTDVGAQCRHLEVLDVSNCWFSTDFILLNVEKLQESLPHLGVLRLANSKFRANMASTRAQAESPGFPLLRELSVACNTDNANGGIGINDNFVFRLLKSSAQLRLLDVRGSTHLTLQGLRQLPITGLHQLYLAQSSVTRHQGLADIVHRWRHTLRVLDLSWNTFTADDLQETLGVLAEQPGESHLNSLNLSGTSVTSPQVKSLLDGCPHLISLSLTSCRGLPRGMKHDYCGPLLASLHKQVNNLTDS